MTITYPLAMPSLKFNALQDDPRSAVGVLISPFTFSQQTFAHPGKILRYSVNAPPTNDEIIGEAWGAFFKTLNGPEGTFLFGNPKRKTPLGSAPGAPQVDGAAQAVNSLTLLTKGWTVSQTNILRAGDTIQIGTAGTSRLYVNVTDADSDGGGLATLDIWPGLRESPADSASIVTASAQGVFRLEGLPSYRVEPGPLYTQIGFTAVEAI